MSDHFIKKEEDMTQRLEMGESEFSGRVIAACTDLVSLSLCTASLRFSSPEVLDQLTTACIHRLVALCGTRQGALFFPPIQQMANLQAMVANQPTISLLACVQISAEEAPIALAQYPFTAAPLQRSMDLPPTLVWRRAFAPPDVPLVHPGQDVRSPAPQVQVLLLLAWLEQEKHGEVRDESMQLFPLPADIVDTILVQLLTAWHKQDVSEDLLPAELLATVGHEFRGPLTTISGYATTLLQYDQQLLSQERREFLAAIGDASAHLGELVDRFLDLAQFETNTVPFAPTAVNLVALAREATTARRPVGHPLLLPLPAAEMRA